MRRFNFPENEQAFIELPDRWQGEHLLRYQEAGSKLENSPLPAMLANFARHIALLENWQLDGMTGHPEKWDFKHADLRQVLWVNTLVSADFNKCFVVPKDWLSPSQNGQAEMTETATAP